MYMVNMNSLQEKHIIYYIVQQNPHFLYFKSCSIFSSQIMENLVCSFVFGRGHMTPFQTKTKNKQFMLQYNVVLTCPVFL